MLFSNEYSESETLKNIHQMSVNKVLSDDAVKTCYTATNSVQLICQKRSERNLDSVAATAS